MRALHKNETWEVVELSKGKKIMSNKWVFTLKYRVDESIERHDAKLVAKGYI